MTSALDRDICPFCGEKEEPHLMMSCITRLVYLHGAAVADIRNAEIERNEARERAELAEYDRRLLLETLRSVVSYEWGKSPTMDSITRHSIDQLVRAVELHK